VVSFAGGDASSAAIEYRTFEALVLLLVELAIKARAGYLVDIRAALTTEGTGAQFGAV
jgi:hypothetical protein